MFTAAAIQFKPLLGEIEANTRLIRGYLAEVKDVSLVILPELASTGYDFADKQMAEVLAQDPDDSNYVRMLKEVAARNGQYIVSGFNEKRGEDLFNSALLIGPEGLLGIYRKMHLFMNEKRFFKAGEGGLCVYDLGFCKIGIQICFDYLFPEPWRILAQKGAELIIHPSNLLTQNAHKALPGIALMNKVFILTANRIGREGELVFNGNSMLISPSGDILSRASSDTAEVLRIDIDPTLSNDKMITPMNHVFNDRRPEQYIADNC